MNKERTYEIEVSSFNSIRIQTKSANISIRGNQNSDKIKINYQENNDSTWYFDENDDELQISNRLENRFFSFLSIIFRIVNITIYLPSSFTGRLNIDNTFGSITVEELQSEQINLNTSNSSISLSSVTLQGKSQVTTSNGRLKLSNVTSADDFQARTSNSLIDLKNVTMAHSLKALTSNSKINGQNIFAETLEATTSNGTICLSELECHRGYIKSSNANIRIFVNDTPYAYRIEAHTSNGSTECNKKPFKDSCLQGDNYLDVKTSNSSIDIFFNK